MFGIRIVFVVSGYGGRFSLLSLSITLGAGLAYLGLATLLTDVCLRYFVKEKDVYDRSKYEDIVTDDEEIKELVGGGNVNGRTIDDDDNQL